MVAAAPGSEPPSCNEPSLSVCCDCEFVMRSLQSAWSGPSSALVRYLLSTYLDAAGWSARASRCPGYDCLAVVFCTRIIAQRCLVRTENVCATESQGSYNLNVCIAQRLETRKNWKRGDVCAGLRGAECGPVPARHAVANDPPPSAPVRNNVYNWRLTYHSQNRCKDCLLYFSRLHYIWGKLNCMQRLKEST